MFHVLPIDDFDRPELAPYRTLKRPTVHAVQGLFVAEGDKVVQRLLASGWPVVSVLLPAARLAEFEPALCAHGGDFPVYTVADKQMLESLVGFPMYQGVMAVGKIPAPATLEDVLAHSTPPRLFLAVDTLANAENLGVLVRSAVAFGVQALIVGETSASPFLRRAVRNSMGAIFELPVVEPPHLPHCLRELRDHGVRCIAAHPHSGGRTIAQSDFRGDCCIVVGSEGHGLSPAVLRACDEAVAIPMPPTVDSLNVGHAAAVFLYEANRQRGRI